MDDRIFFAALLYVIIAVSTVGFLPSDFYTGGQGIPPDIDNLRTDVETENFDADASVGQISFLQKIATFMFFTWGVDALPGVVATIVFTINLFSLMISAIYIYDKVRGIGS